MAAIFVKAMAVGPHQGPVAWVGLLCLSGLPLLLLLSRWPRFAVVLGGTALLFALLSFGLT